MDMITGRTACYRPAYPRELRRLGNERYRVKLHDSELATVEDGYVPPNVTLPDAEQSVFQVGLIYHGIFSYRVGAREWLLDANSSLFIAPRWQPREKQLLPDTGHAAAIVTPAMQTVDEICRHRGGSRALPEGSVPASMRLRLLTQRLLQSAWIGDNPLQTDEWIISALTETIWSEPVRENGPASRVIERAKQLLHDRWSERLSLADIARFAGVTPVYLTQIFTRQEGIPLYRYQLRLRLSRALAELSNCDDITGLALDHGFSSHAHFSSAFRTAFGLTPSEFRSSMRGGGGAEPSIRKVA